MNSETLSIKTIIGELDFLTNSYYSMKHWKKQVSQLFVIKLIKRIPDPTNTKRHYQSYLNRKDIKLV